jgi:hypothetical protein
MALLAILFYFNSIGFKIFNTFSAKSFDLKPDD